MKFFKGENCANQAPLKCCQIPRRARTARAVLPAIRPIIWRAGLRALFE
jgi:hypothetical protein